MPLSADKNYSQKWKLEDHRLVVKMYKSAPNSVLNFKTFLAGVIPVDSVHWVLARCLKPHGREWRKRRGMGRKERGGIEGEG